MAEISFCEAWVSVLATHLGLSSGVQSVPGYSRAPDKWRPHIRYVLGHRGRTWVLSCATESGRAGHSFPHGPIRSTELAALGLALLWRSLAASFQQATKRLGGKWCRSDRGGPGRDR